MELKLTGVAELARTLSDLALNQLPFAQSLALTETAHAIRQAEQAEMRAVFDRPTPWVLNSLQVEPARKERLVAVVRTKDFAGKGTPAHKSLSAQVLGGERRMKRFEKALQAIGALPAGWRAVPGEAAPLDAYGNVPGSLLTRILAYLRAFPEVGYRANRKGGQKRLSGYFVGDGKRFPRGVWQRDSADPRPILIFVQRANYQKRYDFHAVAERTFRARYPEALSKALARAVATARR